MDLLQSQTDSFQDAGTQAVSRSEGWRSLEFQVDAVRDAYTAARQAVVTARQAYVAIRQSGYDVQQHLAAVRLQYMAARRMERASSQAMKAAGQIRVVMPRLLSQADRGDVAHHQQRQAAMLSRLGAVQQTASVTAGGAHQASAGDCSG